MEQCVAFGKISGPTFHHNDSAGLNESTTLWTGTSGIDQLNKIGQNVPCRSRIHCRERRRCVMVSPRSFACF